MRFRFFKCSWPRSFISKRAGRSQSLNTQGANALNTGGTGISTKSFIGAVFQATMAETPRRY